MKYLQASSTPQKMCPLCGQPSLFDEITEFYYCNHCDQFVQWLPDAFALMASGPSGTGKTPNLHYWIDFYLRNSRPVILLAFDDLPSNLRGTLGSYCHDKLPEYENTGLATIVDCYASIAGVQSAEKYSLKNRADLNELSLLTSELLLEKAKIGKAKVFLDSATPLFTYKDPQLVVQFLGSMAAKIKSRGGGFAMSLTTGTVSDEIFARLETLMDFTIEMRFIESDGRKKRQMRFAKARGQRIYEDWVPIYIGTKAISIDIGEDPAKYERLKKALHAKPP